MPNQVHMNVDRYPLFSLRSGLDVVRILFFLLIGSLIFPGLSLAQPASSTSPAPDEDLKALIKTIETQHRGETSKGRTRMNISTQNWKRSMVMETSSEGREKFLARITEPAKERGTCTLKVQNDIWNYFPKIDRLVKIPSSLMGDKWMGSHFTNDDLVKNDLVDEMYDLAKVSEDGRIIVILAVPKPNAAVVWGKLLYTIDRERKIPLSVDYFDEEGVKVRTMTFDQPEKIGQRWVCKRMKVSPLETPEEFTEVLFETLEFDIKLPGNLFSVQSLRKQ